MAWHNAVQGTAAVLLLAIGTPLLWAAWQARGSQTRALAIRATTVDPTIPLLLVAAALSYGAAAIHIAVVPEHFAESVPEGIAFAVLAVFQLATGAFLQMGSTNRLKGAIVAANLAAALMWLITRTTGVPFIPELARPEAVAPRDLAATAFELGIVLVLLGIPRAAASADRIASIASIGLVPMLGLVGIFTLLAVAGPAPTHEHSCPALCAHTHEVVTLSGHRAMARGSDPSTDPSFDPHYRIGKGPIA